MYNVKIPNPSPFSRMQNGGAMGGTRAPMRDIPMGDRLDTAPKRPDGMMPRRRCDGSLRDPAPEETPNISPRRLGDNVRNSMETPCPSDCAIGRCGGWGLENHPLAMVYSPCQAWRDAYPPDVALNRGTLFSELDLPFEGAKNKRGCTL